MVLNDEGLDFMNWWTNYDKNKLEADLMNPRSDAYHRLKGRMFLIAGTHTSMAMKMRHTLGIVSEPMLRSTNIIERSRWPDEAFAWFGGRENEEHMKLVHHRHTESYYDFLKIFRQLWVAAGRPTPTTGRGARLTEHGRWRTLCASRFTGSLTREHEMRNTTDFFTWATKDDRVWDKFDQVILYLKIQNIDIIYIFCATTGAFEIASRS